MSWADNHLFVFILLPTRKRIDNYIMWVNGDHKVLGIWDEIKHLPQYKIKMNQRYYKFADRKNGEVYFMYDILTWQCLISIYILI